MELTAQALQQSCNGNNTPYVLSRKDSSDSLHTHQGLGGYRAAKPPGSPRNSRKISHYYTYYDVNEYPMHDGKGGLIAQHVNKANEKKIDYWGNVCYFCKWEGFKASWSEWWTALCTVLLCLWNGCESRSAKLQQQINDVNNTSLSVESRSIVTNDDEQSALSVVSSVNASSLSGDLGIEDLCLGEKMKQQRLNEPNQVNIDHKGQPKQGNVDDNVSLKDEAIIDTVSNLSLNVDETKDSDDNHSFSAMVPIDYKEKKLSPSNHHSSPRKRLKVDGYKVNYFVTDGDRKKRDEENKAWLDDKKTYGINGDINNWAVYDDDGNKAFPTPLQFALLIKDEETDEQKKILQRVLLQRLEQDDMKTALTKMQQETIFSKAYNKAYNMVSDYLLSNVDDKVNDTPGFANSMLGLIKLAREAVGNSNESELEVNMDAIIHLLLRGHVERDLVLDKKPDFPVVNESFLK